MKNLRTSQGSGTHARNGRAGGYRPPASPAKPRLPDGLKALIFRAEVAQWVARLHVTPRQVRLQAMSHRWACCSPAGTVAFSLDLLHQPTAFRDYVIVYELLRLRAAKDSPLFQTLLRLYIPHHETIRPLPLPFQPEPAARTL